MYVPHRQEGGGCALSAPATHRENFPDFDFFALRHKFPKNLKHLQKSGSEKNFLGIFPGIKFLPIYIIWQKSQKNNLE